MNGQHITERQLIEGILSDPAITEAVTHLYCAMLQVKAERLRNDQTKAPYNALYEIFVEGRKVSTQARKHLFYTVMPTEPASAEAG